MSKTTMERGSASGPAAATADRKPSRASSVWLTICTARPSRLWTWAPGADRLAVGSLAERGRGDGGAPQLRLRDHGLLGRRQGEQLAQHCDQLFHHRGAEAAAVTTRGHA